MYPNNAYYQAIPQRQSFGLKGRPVSSLDEVRASSIDFDGSVFYFPDTANKLIYTKQINMDGTASIAVYELKESTVPASGYGYITREEFNQVIEKLKADLTKPKEEEVPQFKF